MCMRVCIQACVYVCSMLFYWPRDQAAMAAGTAEVVIATTIRVLDIRGEDWDKQLATAIDIDGLVFRCKGGGMCACVSMRVA